MIEIQCHIPVIKATTNNVIFYADPLARMASLEEQLKKLEAERNCILFNALT